MKKVFPQFLMACAAILLLACTGTSRLRDGERLYTGAKASIVKTDKDWDTKILKTDLKKALILPRPNKKIGWMRPKLAVYYTFQNRRKGSIGNFIATRFGEPPVFYEPKIRNRHQELLSERAANDGFFKIQMSSTEKIGKHSVHLRYEVRVRGPREMVDKVDFPADSSLLMQTISKMLPKSLVKPGQPYHLEELIAERQRLSDSLRNHGWYFFSPDHLVFEADTLHRKSERLLNLTLRVKKEVSTRERQPFRLNSITVFTDYDLAKQADSMRQRKDTLRIGCVDFVYRYLAVEPNILNRQIVLRCGEFYSNDDYQATIYHLFNLNQYKFINIRFDLSPQSDSLLDARIYLTPYRSQWVEANFSGVFSPGFYYGIRTGATYNHRNVFRHSDALLLSLNGSYLRTDKNNFDYQYFLVSDALARLTLPRLLFIPKRQRLALGTTQFSLRHQINWFQYNIEDFERFGLSFQRLQAEAGYFWRKNRRGAVVQQANPLNFGLQYSTLNNPILRQQLIASIPGDTTGTLLSLLTFAEYKPNYTFTIDERLGPARRITQYFRQHFAAQASGYLGNKYLPKNYYLPSPLNFFVESEYRRYKKTKGRNVLALRAAVGAGIPLRRGGSVPLSDRYVVGGASSVRAFAPRTIGPGSQGRDSSASMGLSVGKYTGNLLIESSLEYRIPIGRFPELAFFVDAGNVWLTSGADATDASQFRLNRFYQEVAVGTGIGLRVNLGFFVLRLDLAVPLAKPYLPMGERWVGGDLRFGNRSWRRENLNWNFAFGYPF